jgi:hypothetical protein
MALAGTAFAQAFKGGTAGEPALDAKRSGVVNEESDERPRDEMSPHESYSNTDKNVDNAPVYAPGTDPAPRDNATGQKSGETATTPNRPISDSLRAKPVSAGGPGVFLRKLRGFDEPAFR